MNGPVFLLGAGFNRDAKRHAGKIISPYCGEIDCDYPLVGDLARDCFGKNSLDETETIEELFATAIREGDPKPMERLSNKLMEADHYIAERLLLSDTKPSNPYAVFFARFKDCHFLAFNYDSLPEIFLVHHKVWYPHDGYGIPVYGELDPLANEDVRTDIRCRQSSSNVLHLHGSLCIYTRSFDLTREVGNSTLWVVLKENPEYIFDSDSIRDMFFPYKRPPPGPSYQRLDERVVAPVRGHHGGRRGASLWG